MILKDKIILITGASSGIGKSFTKLAAKEGAKVILQARSADKLVSLAQEINNIGGKAFTYPTDLSSADAVQEQSERIKEEVGVPDIIINSAGAGNWLSIFETSESEFVEMMAAPYFATVFTIKSFINDMLKKDTAQIITINSAACYFSYPGALGYLSTRWALLGFQEGLYEELRKTNVAVTSIVAGKVDSPYFTNNPGSDERLPKVATSIMNTLSVEDVAKAIRSAINHRRKTVIIPWQMSLSVWMNRFFPGVFKVLSRATGYKGIKDEISQL